MKNIEYLQSLKKKLSIPNWICRILVLPSIILIGITAPKSTTLATIFTILTAIFIIAGLILDKKIKQLNQQIYDVGTMTQAIEDSRK